MKKPVPYKAPVIWCIGGSDTRAGAGIQADLLTAQDFDVCCVTIISAVTAQSKGAVKNVSAVADSVFMDQLESAADDELPSVIKIGLLATQKHVKLLANWLVFHPTPVIIDPVQIASTGDPLTIEPVDLSPLYGFCAIITPNEDELHALQGKKYLLNAGVNAILLTGTHTQNTVIDTLFTCQQFSELQSSTPPSVEDEHIPIFHEFVHQHTEYSPHSTYTWEHPLVPTKNTHGTGCTLATAIACGIAQHYTLLDAITQAIAYVQKGLMPSKISQSNGSIAHKGWPDNFDYWPNTTTGSSKNDQNIFPALEQPLGLYPVVDNITLLEQLFLLGVRTAQLRIKSKQPPKETISTAIKLANKYDAQLFINDHWQLAIELNAYGVHLGQKDLLTADITAIAKKGLRLGISTHGFFEMCYALPFRPSYLALGHIFPTPTKLMPSKPQGLERLARYTQISNHIPTVAIGGIDLSNAAEILAAKPNSIAVVRAISESTHLKNTLFKFMQLFDRAGVPHNIDTRKFNEALHQQYTCSHNG